MHDERARVGVGLIADRVRRAAGQGDDLARPGGEAAHRLLRVSEIEGELALLHVVDLAGSMAMHDRRTSPRRHPDLDREERTPGVCTTGNDGQFIGAEREPLDSGTIDRYLVHTII